MIMDTNYIPLLLPLDKPFEKLNKKEAKQYFDWFVSHIDDRAEYLREKVSEGLSISPSTVQYSIDSFIPVWQWFMKSAIIQTTSKLRLIQLRNELKKQHEPKEFIDDMVRANSKELSLISLYMLRDIGMFVGKVFIYNYPVLKWGYHTNTKQDSFANIPQVFGFINTSYNPPFEMQFDPIHYAEMSASNLLDGTASSSDLYNDCLRWIKWIPNNK